MCWNQILTHGGSHRCMMDSDDEVRDRATFYMNVLQQKQKALNAAYIFNGELGHSHSLTLRIHCLTATHRACWSKCTLTQQVKAEMLTFAPPVCCSQVSLFPSPDWRSPSTSTLWSPQRNLSTWRVSLWPPLLLSAQGFLLIFETITVRNRTVKEPHLMFFSSQKLPLCCHQQPAREVGPVTPGHLSG